MLRRFFFGALALFMLASPALACVGKSLVIGTDSTPESKVVAHILSTLIYERTGTTVEIVDYKDSEALFKELSQGDVDLALDYAGRALARTGRPLPADSGAALDEARKVYQETFNLVWLTPLGFFESGKPASPGATVAQKHTLKKFPALPRLIAKTSDLLPSETLKGIIGAPNTAKAARDFLKKNKLI